MDGNTRKKRGFPQKITLCWKCANAVPCDKPFRGCAWSIFGVPVTGWDAEPTVILGGKHGDIVARSYYVKACPDFENDVFKYEGRAEA